MNQRVVAVIGGVLAIVVAVILLRPPSANNEQASVTVSPSSETAYHNVTFGYTIENSRQWPVDESQADAVIIGALPGEPAPGEWLSITVSRVGKANIIEELQTNIEQACLEPAEVTLAHVSATKVTCESAFAGDEAYYYLIERGDFVFSLYLLKNPDSEVHKTLEQMVQSFRVES